MKVISITAILLNLVMIIKVKVILMIIMDTKKLLTVRMLIVHTVMSHMAINMSM